jgi:hypothetical protein
MDTQFIEMMVINLITFKSGAQFIEMIVVNLITFKAGAKLMLLFNRPSSVTYLLNILI